MVLILRFFRTSLIQTNYKLQDEQIIGDTRPHFWSMTVDSATLLVAL